MLTIGEMMTFHRIERERYEKLLSQGIPTSTARNIMALWIYLQFIGINLLTYLSGCHNNPLIQRFVAEAQLILQCVGASATPPRQARAAIPLTSSLATEQLNLRFFYFNKDVVARGMAYVMDSIGTIVFAPAMNLDLGMPYYCRIMPNAVDCKTLLITSDSFRVRSGDIVEFFETRWNNSIETVMLEETTRGVMPIYGRIVLKSHHFVDVIFNNEPVLGMVIGAGTIMVRKFSFN